MRTRRDAPAAGETFDELFARERGPMVRLAYLITGSAAVGEEVAHDAFVAVYERWGRLDDPGPYLRRCVVNAAIRSKARRRRGDELSLVAAGPDVARPGAGTGPEPFDHTLDAVGRLAPRARALVVLRYYDQLSMEEIANVLQIPTGTVKSGLHRALAQLREVLA